MEKRQPKYELMNPKLLPKKPPDWLLIKIQQSLSYDNKTGSIVWAVKNNKINPGDEAGKIDKRNYRIIEFRSAKYKFYRAIASHHIAWYLHYGNWPEQQIDHKNGVRNDNRLKNLRVCDRYGNAKNHAIYKNNVSGVSGVEIVKNRYRASIRVDKKRIWLGSFSSLQEAKFARLNAEKKYFKEFRRKTIKYNWAKLLYTCLNEV